MLPYVISREGERTEFRPTPLFVSLMISGFAMGACLCACLGLWLIAAAWPDWPGLLVGFAFLLGAILGCILTVWAWRTRNAALTIERAGVVSYGTKQLCDVASVRHVLIAPARSGEGDRDVTLELHDGSQVSIPSQYFAGLSTHALANDFADHLATALAVPVKSI